LNHEKKERNPADGGSRDETGLSLSMAAFVNPAEKLHTFAVHISH